MIRDFVQHDRARDNQSIEERKKKNVMNRTGMYQGVTKGNFFFLPCISIFILIKQIYISCLLTTSISDGSSTTHSLIRY
jgi:hypothetical protein